MTLNNDKDMREARALKIRELASITDKLERYQATLSWIEYCGAYPELAGDKPTEYFSVLAAYVQDPTLLKKVG